MNLNINQSMMLKDILTKVYEPILSNGVVDNGESLILCYANRKYNGFITKSFYNLDDFVNEVKNSQQVKYCETYFNLATSKNGARSKEDLATRTVLAFDFDKKDFINKGIELNIDYIQRKFQENNLYYNLLIDSGNGFHAYIFLNPTQDTELVVKVQEELAKKLGADKNACKSTQILRVPFTWNNKKLSEGIRKPVNIVYLDEKPKRKDINKIANRLFRTEYGKTTKTYKGTSCNKVNELMSVPVEKATSRHEELLWLYGKLLKMNNTQAQIEIACEKFQELNKLEDYKQQIQWLQKNGKPYSSCGDCKYKSQCFKVVESDFEFENGESLITTNEKIFSKCKKKGAKRMNGNQIVVYGVLKLHNKPLFKDELLEEITFRNKKKEVINVAMSERTLATTLKEMEELKYISSETVGRKKAYKLNRERTQEELNIIVRASVVYDVVKGFMTQEELQFYCFLRYLQSEQKRLDPNINGNKFVMAQEVIAKKYGVTRQYVNELISELERKKYIRKEYRQSSNNMYDYCVYYLVH